MSTYPGTDLLVRFCYGCAIEIHEKSDVWVDVDSNCCVCPTCAAEALDAYPEATIVPGSQFETEILNQISEG